MMIAENPVQFAAAPPRHSCGSRNPFLAAWYKVFHYPRFELLDSDVRENDEQGFSGNVPLQFCVSSKLLKRTRETGHERASRDA